MPVCRYNLFAFLLTGSLNVGEGIRLYKEQAAIVDFLYVWQYKQLLGYMVGSLSGIWVFPLENTSCALANVALLSGCAWQRTLPDRFHSASWSCCEMAGKLLQWWTSLWQGTPAAILITHLVSLLSGQVVALPAVERAGHQERLTV